MQRRFVRRSYGDSTHTRLPLTFKKSSDVWIKAFLRLVGRLVLGDAKSATFTRLALEHAGIVSADKQSRFAQLFQLHRAVTPQLLEALKKDGTFKEEEIADLRTSYQLADLTRNDFATVKILKEEFDIRKPEQIRSLAKLSKSEWVDLIASNHKEGKIELPLGLKDTTGKMQVPEAELYAMLLEHRLLETFPTTAFAGGLERALAKGNVRGVKNARSWDELLKSNRNSICSARPSTSS